MCRGFCFGLILFVACAAPEPAARAPKRVISLAPNVTEILYAIHAGDLLVGTDEVSDTPAEAAKLPKVGAGLSPNLEKIVALRPDLVIAIAAGLHPSLARSLAAQHIPLLVVRSDRMTQVPSAIESIANAIHRDASSTIANLLRQEQAQRRTRAKRPRVLVAVWTDPLYVAGRDTFTNDLLQLTGARNVVHADGWPVYPLESFVASPPDLLLYPNRSVTRAQIDALLARAGVTCEVVAIDENLFMRPGPRMGEAAAELNRILDAWERRP